jgi:transposase
MKKQRKHYTPEEKVAILRRHLLEKEPISKLCDELGLQPAAEPPGIAASRSSMTR